MKTEKNDYAKSFGLSFKLVPETTALLIIDLQNASASRTKGLGKLLKEQGREEAGEYRFNRIENVILPNVQKLLKYFREKELNIIYVTLGSEKDDFSDLPPNVYSLIKSTDNRKGTETNDVLDEIKPLSNELVINKTTMSAFVSTNINSVLKKMNIKYLLCCGVSTNSCVQSTAMNAADYGYYCVLVDDACGAAKEKFHLATIENFGRLCGRVACTEAVLEELESYQK